MNCCRLLAGYMLLLVGHISMSVVRLQSLSGVVVKPIRECVGKLRFKFTDCFCFHYSGRRSIPVMDDLFEKKRALGINFAPVDVDYKLMSMGSGICIECSYPTMLNV